MKVTLSMPRDVLAAIERERKARGLSRSEFVRRAVEETLRRQRDQRAAAAYARGYQEQPESPQDVAPFVEAGERAVTTLAPWE